MILPFVIPTKNSSTGDSLRLRFSDEGFGFKHIGKEGEEDGFLVEGFHFRCLYLLCTFYQLIRLRHVKDEFVADELGGSVVGVGTAQRLGADAPQRGRTRRTRMRFGANRQSPLSAVTLSSQRTNSTEGGEDHGDALDMDSHTKDNGVEVFAEHSDECRVRGLKVMAETGALVGREAELTRFDKEQFLVKVIELFGCCFDDIAGVLGGVYILAVEGLVFIDDEGEQAREVTVFDRRHEGVVLAEGTGEDHGELGVLDDGRFFAAGTGDSLVLGRFTERGVVVGGRRTPDVGDDRTFGLMDIAATVLFGERLVESRVRRIARDDERHLLMNRFDEFEGKVGDTLSASRRTDDEELEVRVV